MTLGCTAVDLPEQERLALLDFVGLGIAIAGRPALDHVGDVDLVTLEVYRLNHLRQQLPRAADKRDPLDVLVGARRLAHEHQIRIRIANAEHDLVLPWA